MKVKMKAKDIFEDEDEGDPLVPLLFAVVSRTGLYRYQTALEAVDAARDIARREPGTVAYILRPVQEAVVELPPVTVRAVQSI